MVKGIYSKQVDGLQGCDFVLIIVCSDCCLMFWGMFGNVYELLWSLCFKFLYMIIILF